MTSRFGDAKSAGFALAATLAGDRALSEVRGTLAPEDEVCVRAHCAHDVEGDRARIIARLLAYVRPPLSGLPRALPQRLRTALARNLPADEARETMQGAARARAGYEPEPGLLPRLLRIARHAISPSRGELP